MFLHSLATELFINKKLYHQCIICRPKCSPKKHREPIGDEPEDLKGSLSLLFFFFKVNIYVTILSFTKHSKAFLGKCQLVSQRAEA